MSNINGQMKKTIRLVFLMALFVMQACGTTTSQAEHKPAPAIESFSPPDPDSITSAIPTDAPAGKPGQEPPIPSGLQVVYLRAGDIWSWSEAGVGVKLTETGDISTVCLSDDGQLLAFMRGREVWTMHASGTDARLVKILDAESARLWFAPNVLFLAVSTRDHIEVIDLNNAASTTVVTYPPIPNDYYPEIVWSPDSMGFKTVIPPQLETGQAEFLFVFTNGTVASLAKFMIKSNPGSKPHISPDGGYIIYVTKEDEGIEALHVMDSSGATRSYGEPANSIRTYGWLPDSQHFLYGEQNLQGAFLGDVGAPPTKIAIVPATVICWVNAEQYLALEKDALVLGDLSGRSTLIDTDVKEFDFVLRTSSP